MKKLICFVDNTPYSEGVGTFYVAADSIDEAKELYKNYIFSNSYWGDEVTEHEMCKTYKKNLERFNIKECPGVFVDDSRGNRIIYNIEDVSSDFLI